MYRKQSVMSGKVYRKYQFCSKSMSAQWFTSGPIWLKSDNVLELLRIYMHMYLE